MPDTSPSQQTNKSQLIQKLFTEIKEQAQKHNFSQAEALRDQLMKIDPTALGEILGAAEIIEKEKTAGLDQAHLAIWSDLYEELSDEERNCLFYSMRKINVPPKKVILKQGGLNKRLFLINDGQVNILQEKNGNNVVVASLGRGELLGEYTFTTISLCSASVVSSTKVELMALESEATDSWSEQQPALLNKLIRFCERHGRVGLISQQKQMKKSEHPRYELTGAIDAILLTKEGEKSDQSFKGGLSDISLSGCCIDIRCSSRKTARALLAKPLYLQIEVEQGSRKHELNVFGEIVQVSFHLYNEYSVHVRFLKELEQSSLAPFLPKC